MSKNKLIVKQVEKEEKPLEEGFDESVQLNVNKPPKKESNNRSRPVTTAIRTVISGNFIKEYVLKNIAFIFFIVFITLLYISNTYYALGTLREIEKTKNQIKELRYEYVSTKKEVIEKSRRNKVIEKLKYVNKELKESKVPPYKIEMDNKQMKQ